MLYKGFKIGVFYKHRAWAEKWFDNFIKSTDGACILRYVKNGLYPFFIELRDGTRITSYSVDDTAKGIYVDKAFVESSVGDEIIEAVIKTFIDYTKSVIIED